jgi:ribulose-phosphate 3-epimerase
MSNMSRRAVDSLDKSRLIGEFSVWSADLIQLSSELDRISSHADVLHIDVADGHFAPAFLFFPDLVLAIRKSTNLLIHVHLMVSDHILLDQVDQFSAAGADVISIHAENLIVADSALDLIASKGLKSGMVLKVGTPVEAVKPFIPKLSFLTLLGTEIGIKGANLSDKAEARLREAASLLEASGRREQVFLAADGGIREHTVPLLRKAGADTVVLGSLAFNAPSLEQRMTWLRTL